MLLQFIICALLCYITFIFSSVIIKEFKALAEAVISEIRGNRKDRQPGHIL